MNQRIIKFRAWDVKTKAMIVSPQRINLIWNKGKTGVFIRDMKDDDEAGYMKRDAILMQFTGLFDRNGKEIFESDIVKISSNQVKQVVFFADAQFCMNKKGDPAMSSVSPFGYQLEVIGNIHEHPGLLGEKP